MPRHDRALWRGLTQIAAGYCQVQRGNGAGAVALLERAVDLLAPYPAQHQGIAITHLIDETRGMTNSIRSQATSPGLTFPPLAAAVEVSR